jgi:hypothetical protein
MIISLHPEIAERAETVRETTDGGTDNAQAYRILGIIVKLQKELADQGYNPR